MSPAKPLTRSRANAMIGGVCAGVAQWLGWDPTLVRLLWILVGVFSAGFFAVLAYILLYFVMPQVS